jgi:hypothetical protein
MFGLGGAIEVTFAGGTNDTWIAAESGMTTPRKFGTEKSYVSSSTTPMTMFPFTAPYSVYAGSCTEDEPHLINSAVKDTEALVTGGATVKVAPPVPPVAIKVYSGTSASKGFLIEGVEVKLEDTGCKTERKSKTNSAGALERPNMPFGKYTLCVAGGTTGGKQGANKELGKERKYTVSFANDTTLGPSTIEKGTLTNGGSVTNGGVKEAVIYLNSGASGVTTTSAPC